MASLRDALDSVETFMAVLEDGDMTPKAFDGWVGWEDVLALYDVVKSQSELLHGMAGELDARGGWTKDLAQHYHEIQSLSE